jgi:hypothetical protein
VLAGCVLALLAVSAMTKLYPFPRGALVDENGEPTVVGRTYLQGIQDITQAVNDVTNLDSGTSYSAAQLRDKIIELISALQG